MKNSNLLLLQHYKIEMNWTARYQNLYSKFSDILWFSYQIREYSAPNMVFWILKSVNEENWKTASLNFLQQFKDAVLICKSCTVRRCFRVWYLWIILVVAQFALTLTCSKELTSISSNVFVRKKILCRGIFGQRVDSSSLTGFNEA